MASNSFEMPMSRLMNEVTLEVRITGMRSHAIRRWIAIGLIKMAALVLGIGVVHVEMDLHA